MTELDRHDDLFYVVVLTWDIVGYRVNVQRCGRSELWLPCFCTVMQLPPTLVMLCITPDAADPSGTGRLPLSTASRSMSYFMTHHMSCRTLLLLGRRGSS